MGIVLGNLNKLDNGESAVTFAINSICWATLITSIALFIYIEVIDQLINYIPHRRDIKYKNFHKRIKI